MNKIVSTIFSAQYRAIVAIVLIVVVAGLVKPTFLAGGNLSFVVIQSSVVGVIGMGELLVILIGSIDLSPASIGTLAGITVATNIGKSGSELSLLYAIALALAVCFSLGILNGLLVVAGKIPSIIATLGTQIAIGGFAFYYTKGAGLVIPSGSFFEISNGTLFGISNMIWILIIVTILVQLMLSFTRVGQHIFALGSNELAAVYSGVRNSALKVMTFGTAGLIYGIGGIMLVSQVASVYPGLMNGYEINAIAAVVVGGTKLMGSSGEGSAWQTLVGALLLALIANALIVTGVSGYLQEFVTGLVLILAVMRTSREKIIK